MFKNGVLIEKPSDSAAKLLKRTKKSEHITALLTVLLFGLIFTILLLYSEALHGPCKGTRPAVLVPTGVRLLMFARRLRAVRASGLWNNLPEEICLLYNHC